MRPEVLADIERHLRDEAQRDDITEFLGGFDYATRTKARVRKYSFVVEVEPGAVALTPGEQNAFAWIDATALDDLPMAPEMREAVSSLIS
jgi:8-oxo-dGTP diphosphatase